MNLFCRTILSPDEASAENSLWNAGALHCQTPLVRFAVDLPTASRRSIVQLQTCRGFAVDSARISCRPYICRRLLIFGTHFYASCRRFAVDRTICRGFAADFCRRLNWLQVGLKSTANRNVNSIDAICRGVNDKSKKSRHFEMFLICRRDRTICCGFAVDWSLRRIYSKSHQWSLTSTELHVRPPPRCKISAQAVSTILP